MVSHRSGEEERSAENVARKDRLPVEEMADGGRRQVTLLTFSRLEVLFLRFYASQSSLSC